MEPGTPYVENKPDGLRCPPADATGLSAIRILRGGGMRQFSAVEFARGWAGVEHFIRTCWALGKIKPSSSMPSYGVLDVLDADGEIIGDYDIPDADAWRFIYRKLGLRAVPVPAEARGR